MNKFLMALRSRTTWTLVVTVAINIIPFFRRVIPAPAMDLTTVGLGALATYLHVNPSMQYSTPTQIVAQANPLIATVPARFPVQEPPKL